MPPVDWARPATPDAVGLAPAEADVPAARMGLRSVWVDRDLTGHPAKLADRRITSMRRLAEAVSDVSAIPARD